MIRGFARAIGISAAIVFTLVGFGMLIAYNPADYAAFVEVIDVLIVNRIVIGSAMIVVGVFAGLVVLWGPLAVISRVRIWRARQEDGNLGKYDDPDYLNQRD